MEMTQHPPLTPAIRRSTPLESPLDLLKTQPFFDGMPETELRAVAELMRPLTFAKGEVIYAQGSKPDGM
jgi:hypothetical protein